MLGVQVEKLKAEAIEKEKARKAALNAVDVKEGDYQIQVLAAAGDGAAAVLCSSV